jgi:hypothetical protein
MVAVFRRLIARCQSAPQLEADGLSRQIRLSWVFAIHFPNNDLHTLAGHCAWANREPQNVHSIHRRFTKRLAMKQTMEQSLVTIPGNGTAKASPRLLS